MNSEEIRERFLSFFRKRGHAVISSASLIPENDPTVLFNTAGMQPLVPYLLGQKHPLGTRLVDVQKCVRTGDIDDIGDNTHATFFEMLGNWSLGDYFKEEAIKWSYELLTSSEGFSLDPKRLYITVFEGDVHTPKDTEAFEIWKKVGIPENRIYFKGADSNWWPAVKTKEGKEGRDTWTGPTGPCSEMFYDVTKNGLGDLTKEQYEKADESQQIVEIWNDVFMEFEKKNGIIVKKLEQKNVDTGAGLERIAAILQAKNSIFSTDLFLPILDKINQFTSSSNERAKRIVADHVRTAVFMIGDGVLPANTDRGYILRRLLRRAVRYADQLEMKHGSLFWIAETVILKYQSIYENLKNQSALIKAEIDKEEQKFRVTLKKGLKEFTKLSKLGEKAISGKDAFMLFSTYGFPIELTAELAKENSITLDTDEFSKEFEKHQALSRTGAEQKFKGGLADAGEMSIKYHTATHLLHQALRDVLGKHIGQKGSNITSERLRFDFSHPQKMTPEEIKTVEDILNKKIREKLPMNFVVLPKEQAEKSGALHFFGEKYGEMVTVYYLGDDLATAYSKEYCGGPHVKNTSELGTFKIVKEEAVSSGVRRIKAILL